MNQTNRCCRYGTHLIAATSVSFGLSNDSGLLPDAMRQAVEHIPIDCLLGDAGYDAESNRQICRNELNIRPTVIPVNDRNRKNAQLTIGQDISLTPCGDHQHKMWKFFVEKV
jgi:hypothetical protein